jgi:hypothetical protein
MACDQSTRAQPGVRGRPDVKTILNFRLAYHRGRERIETLDVTVPDDGLVAGVDFAGARWRLELSEREISPGRLSGRFTATVEKGRADAVAAGLAWVFTQWTVDNYVLVPGAVYAGNRFHALRRPYPPHVRDIGQSVEQLRLDVGDIPRLNDLPGRSHLDQTSLDCATPGMGIHRPDMQDAFLWLTPQGCARGPIGLELIESEARDVAEVVLLAPGFLHPLPGDNDPMKGIGNQATAYLHPENARPVSLEAGEHIEFTFERHHFAAEGRHALFEQLFVHRTALFSDAKERPLPEVLPFSSAWEVLEQKHNAENWRESHGLYTAGIAWAPDQATQFWQSGWIGGGITTYAMMQEGSALSVNRAERNLDFLLTQGVSPRGLFRSTMNESGEWKGDARIRAESWSRPDEAAGGASLPESCVLARRQGDCLLFALRQLLLLRERGREVPGRWVDAVRRAADALCEVWEREREFGFLLDCETGAVVIRGSTSGALIPCALALASTYFGEARYLSVALACAEQYRTHDLAWGVTTGGPGDALQAPDSESICGLIESFIALFERTGDTRWRVAAERACHQAASWVISYAYLFPAGTALAQIGCDARGTIIANAQNKCGVPGICTLSGQGILRTFRATGDVRLLDLLREIAHALPQFLSREDRQIPTRITWGHAHRELPAGWMCERVNITPSWAEPLGEQAAYSCWCEVAMMLTWCDLPGVYAQPDSGLICCLDHVRAQWTDEDRTGLRIANATAFPARVRVHVETAAAARRVVLPPNYAASLPVVFVEAGGTARASSIPPLQV